MALDIAITRHNAFIEIVVSGSYDLNDAINKFTHALDVCRLTKLTKVLIDYRALPGERGGTEKSLYAFGIENLYEKYLKSGGHALKIAYVGSMLVRYEPGVEIAEKNKLPFKLFENVNEALKWLGVTNT